MYRPTDSATCMSLALQGVAAAPREIGAAVASPLVDRLMTWLHVAQWQDQVGEVPCMALAVGLEAVVKLEMGYGEAVICRLR